MPLFSWLSGKLEKSFVDAIGNSKIMQRFALKTHLHWENAKRQGMLTAEGNEHARNAMSNWDSLCAILKDVKERVGRRVKLFK